MRLRVAGHLVAGLGQCPQRRRLSGGVPTHDEERGSYRRLGEQVGDAREGVGVDERVGGEVPVAVADQMKVDGVDVHVDGGEGTAHRGFPSTLGAARS